MAYIVEQLSYNDIVSFGNAENEIIAQSLYFKRDFVLRRATPRFALTTRDPQRTVQFRCDLRKAQSSDNLLNITSDPILSSSWINDESLVTNGYVQFTFDGVTILPSGFYYLCFVPNVDIIYEIQMSIQNSGSFLGNLIKVEHGTGGYRPNSSLTIKIDGSWQSGSAIRAMVEADQYALTTIKDGS